MRTNILIVLSFLWALSALAATHPQKVVTFYSGLKQLETVYSFDKANIIQGQLASCFMASENSGIMLTVDGFEEMSSSLYTMKLFQMFYSERNTKINYNIVKTESVEQPDQNKSMQQRGARLLVSYVNKTYNQSGQIKTYNDKVFTSVSNGLITEIINSEPSDNTVRHRVSLTVEQLRSRAAYYYSKGKYELAYEYYEQLISMVPKDGDAAYRIALLTFWRKGCKDKFSKKGARKKAGEYIDIAVTYGDSEISSKASNVRNNWNNNNVYF